MACNAHAVFIHGREMGDSLQILEDPILISLLCLTLLCDFLIIFLRHQLLPISHLLIVRPNKNKRALGPWVANLRITVYKGIGKQNSSQILISCFIKT